MTVDRLITAVGVVVLVIVCMVVQSLSFWERATLLTMAIVGVKALLSKSCEEPLVNRASVADFFLAVLLAVGFTGLGYLLWL